MVRVCALPHNNKYVGAYALQNNKANWMHERRSWNSNIEQGDIQERTGILRGKHWDFFKCLGFTRDNLHGLKFAYSAYPVIRFKQFTYLPLNFEYNSP